MRAMDNCASSWSFDIWQYPHAQALACSLRASNPGLPLIVLSVEGDLAPATLAAVQEIAQLRLVDEFYIPNHNSPRCHRRMFACTTAISQGATGASVNLLPLHKLCSTQVRAVP